MFGAKGSKISSQSASETQGVRPSLLPTWVQWPRLAGRGRRCHVTQVTWWSWRSACSSSSWPRPPGRSWRSSHTVEPCCPRPPAVPRAGPDGRKGCPGRLGEARWSRPSGPSLPQPSSWGCRQTGACLNSRWGSRRTTLRKWVPRGQMLGSPAAASPVTKWPGVSRKRNRPRSVSRLPPQTPGSCFCRKGWRLGAFRTSLEWKEAEIYLYLCNNILLEGLF